MFGVHYPGGEALTVQQIRDIDVLAIEHVGIPGVVLMENAGRGCAAFIYRALLRPDSDRVLILAGPGNNGGDGFVIARHLLNASVGVTVALATAPNEVRGDAATNLRILERISAPIIRADEQAGMETVRQIAAGTTLIVDALLGTGARGAPRGTLAELVVLANASTARRIAIDMPTGMDADSGEVFSPCFRADVTLTMVAAKVGFQATSEARDVVGRVEVIDIGAPTGLIPGRQG